MWGREFIINVSLPIARLIPVKLTVLPEIVSIQVSRASFIALTMSLFLSLAIWLASAFATLSVMSGWRLRARQLMVIVLFGSLSTYTGFVMWNGKNAVAADLRTGVAETSALIAQYQSQDHETRSQLTNELTGQHDIIARERADVIRKLMLDELAARLEYATALFDGWSSYGDFSETFQSLADHFADLSQCEFDRGCLTGRRGDGAVGRSLQIISSTFVHAATQWSRLNTAFSDAETHLSSLQARVSQALNEDDFQTARHTLNEITALIRDRLRREPVPILTALVASIDQPIEKHVFSVERDLADIQKQSLLNLKSNLESHSGEFKAKIHAWNEWHDTLLDQQRPATVQPDAVRLDLVQELTRLTDIIELIQPLSQARKRAYGTIVSDINAIDHKIAQLRDEHDLTERSAILVMSINDTRRQLRRLSALDPSAIMASIKTLSISRAYLIDRATQLVPIYPDVSEFKQTPLMLVIWTHFLLGLIPMLLQLTLDFGFTIGILSIIAQFHRAPQSSA